MTHGGFGGQGREIKISQELFQCVDVYAFIHGGTGTPAFAGVKAYTAGQSGEGGTALEDFQSFFKAVLLNQMVVGPYIRPCGAGRHAGRELRLTGIQPEDVEAAGFEALTAACTRLGIYVSYQRRSS